MFSNQKSSPEFEEFLDFLGDRVALHGWPNFRAGILIFYSFGTELTVIRS